MSRRRAALSVAAAAALALTLGSCASEPDQTPQESASSASSSATSAATEVTAAPVDDSLAVTVSGAAGAAPETQITTPLSVEKTVKKVVTAGTGPEVTLDDTVTFNYALYGGSDGQQVDSSYDGPTRPRFAMSQITRGIASGFVGSKVGDRVVVAISPTDGFGTSATNFGEQYDANTTFVLVADIIAAEKTRTAADGAPVTDVPADLPKVTLTDDRPTGFDVSGISEAVKAPADTIAQDLLTGTGPVVASGQTVVMQYVGATIDGKVFESSWETQPFTTVIGAGRVIQGWDKGLVGKTVGSRVLLVIPADQAYGTDASSGRPTGTLIFVVDILDAY
ncbi:FKBP-type peptidyl-prolyl cis-trans isomerase [Kineococcus gynurae]|uniref:peptidylprolyl isomerase n=1 Tax=Kineococcus gynurae TaxID=452979 RepID=A0ABV5LQX2_9ACTN